MTKSANTILKSSKAARGGGWGLVRNTGHDLTVVLMNSQYLWLPTEGLQKRKPLKGLTGWQEPQRA